MRWLILVALFMTPAFGQFDRLQESRRQVDGITTHAGARDGTYRRVEIVQCVEGGDCSSHVIDERRPPSPAKTRKRQIGAAALGGALGLAFAGSWTGIAAGAGIGFGGALLAESYGREHRDHREQFLEYHQRSPQQRGPADSIDCRIGRILGRPDECR